MGKLFWIAVAGAAGTLSRYGLARFVQKFAGPSFPAGTLVVNLAGCLAFGLVWGLVEKRLPWAGEFRFIVLTGYMGAFTTFSTYMFETATLVRLSQWWLAAANLVGQTTLGLLLVFAGLALSRAL